MPDKSEGEPPEGGAVDDGWAELLGDGDSAPPPPAVEPSPAVAVPEAARAAESTADDAGKAASGVRAAEEPKDAVARGEETEASRPERQKEARGKATNQLFFAPPGDGETKEEAATGLEADEAAPTDADDEEEPATEDEQPHEAEEEKPDDAERKEPDAAAASGADEPRRQTTADEQPPEPRLTATGSARAEGGSSWGFVGALVVAAALVGAWVMSTRNGDSPKGSPKTRTTQKRSEVDHTDRPLRANRADDEKTAAPAGRAQGAQSVTDQAAKRPALQPEKPAVEPEAGNEPPPEEAMAEATEPGADGRVVPPGTPPEIAKVFASLPATQFDRQPVGKIGTSGIHIDQISMGTEYESSHCGGQPDGFSISKRQRANVCFRVVHDRNQTEQLRVLWQRDGGTVRRTTLSVPEVHAYRTRAFLVLRKEYAGRWTVRIMSMDGIELAAHAFSVVE